MDYRVIVSIGATVLAFVGYVPYIRDIIKRKTTPHAFTWFIWTLAVGISCGLQIVGGAGVGAWTTGVVTAVCLAIFLLSLRTGTKDITRMDILFLLLALAALALWIFAKAPLWSAILIVLTDALAFIPTIRKSWNKPHSETLSSYEMNGLGYGLSIFALQQYNVLTLLYPGFWLVADTVFSMVLTVRRRAVSQKHYV